ncbi:hypothetical protein ACOMHN_036082 [Nucella lapillus]
MTGGTGDRAITMGNDSVGSGELTVLDTDHIDHMATSCSTTGTETMDRTGERTTGSKNSPMDNTEDSEMTNWAIICLSETSSPVSPSH